MPDRIGLSWSRSAIQVGAALFLMSTAACVQEDWGGPKGPPITSKVEAVPPPGALPPSDGGSGGSVAETTSDTSVVLPPSNGESFSGDGGGALSPRVEASITGGKIPGFDEAVAGMRSTLKACVEGKGTPNARVEITARIGPKGTVLKSDKVGGTSFAQGAVPCLVKRIEGAQFKKPTEGSPRITFRVRMAND